MTEICTALEKIVSRPVSGVERGWLASDLILPPFVIHMVLEADPSRPLRLDIAHWQQAIEAVARVQPGVRVRLAGHLGWSRWVSDGALPRLREVDGSGWDGSGPADAPFMNDHLYPRTGPMVEVVIAHGTPTRVVVRCHHAAMDAGAMLYFADDLFRALRGEELLGAEGGPPIDADIGAQLGNNTRRESTLICPSPTGAPAGDRMARTWFRTSAPGSFKELLAQVALSLAESADVAEPGLMRVDIPVDFRRHNTTIRSSANLTGFVRVPLDAVIHASQPVSAFAARVRDLVARGVHGSVPLSMRPLRWIPLSLMKWLGKGGCRRALRKNRFDISAVLSNMGRLEPSLYCGGGFETQAVFFVPPPSPVVPLFLMLTGSPTNVELCGSMPQALASDGRLQRLLTDVASRLRSN